MYVSLTSDLRAETFFEKVEAAKNGGIDFEIGDIGTSAHTLVLKVEENFMQSLSTFLLLSWYLKNSL